MMQMLAILGAMTAAASFAGVQLIERIAYHRQWLDHPTHRGSHHVATARGGGLAIVVMSVAVSLALLWRGGLLDVRWLTALAAACAIAAVSWLDDLHSLRSSVRFGVHLLAAGAIVAAYGPVRAIALPLLPVWQTGAAGSWVAVLLTLFWIVGMTNAYNFMDGIDGLAGLQALIGGVAWLLLATTVGLPAIAVVAGTVAAASAGFLFRNWTPASIFMGDVGSAFLGFIFALLPVAAARHDPRMAVAGVLVMWPFVFDSTFTILRRLRHGENITQPHNTHLYQRLVKSGLPHARVASLYGALALLGGGVAYCVIRGGVTAAAACVSLPFAAAGLWLVVVARERATTTGTLL